MKSFFICNFDSKLIKPIHPPSKVWWFCWLNNHKKDEDEKGYVYTVRIKQNNGRVVHATLFFKDKKGPTFEDLKKELDGMGVKNDSYSNNGIIIINRIIMSGEEFDRFVGDDGRYY